MAEKKKLPLSITTPLGDKLNIRKLTAEERISGLFRFELGMVSKENSLAFADMVGKSVTVSMDYGAGLKRHFNGIVGRFIQSGSDRRNTTYYAELLPWFWLLTLSRDSRIFQNKTVPEIIKALFSELGQTDFEDALKGTYKPREYCVQYQETAFNFVSRLMEEEGIFYFFKHEAAKHTLVLADDAANHPPCPGLTKARLARSFSKVEEDDVLMRVTLEQRVTTGKYSVEDYNFETPSTDLLVTSAGTTSHRMYEYPAGFGVTGDGEKIANKRLQACELPGKLLRGDGRCRAFTAGYKFTLAEHGRADINGDYVLSQITHSATQDNYSNSFVAIPSATPFRAPRVTPKPQIPGTQSALVVGPSGEEIFTDKYGRVKVQFYWDQLGKKNENSSCWVRVSQGWAGKAWGSIFIPRIGQEVLVSYLEGDPDCPVITGSVYNAEQTVPYDLPAKKTVSTIKTRSSAKGDTTMFNEIRFEDAKDSEEIYIHAQKDMNIVVENNRTTVVGDPDTAKEGNETITVKNNRTTTISEGNETLTVEKGNRVVTVTKGNNTTLVSEGNETLTVSKGNNDHVVDKGNLTVKVNTGNYTLTVKGNLLIDVTGTVTIKSGQTIDIKATADATIKGQNVTVDAGMNLTNKAGVKLVNQAVQVTNDASAKLENKAGGMHDVTAGGILKIAGSLVKIN
jgi:type VI secretion system secreted protein VgrG